MLSVAVQGGMIVSGGADCTIRVWDAATGRQLAPPLAEHTGAVLCLSFCVGRIVSGSDDATIRVSLVNNNSTFFS